MSEGTGVSLRDHPQAAREITKKHVFFPCIAERDLVVLLVFLCFCDVRQGF